MIRIFKIKALTQIICFSILLMFLIVSCSSHPQNHTHFREWTVRLKDSIGIIHIELPPEYDTVHIWRCDDDYPGGDQYYYRIQPAKCSMKEEGCFLRLMEDTFYALTIAHAVYPEPEPKVAFDPHRILRKQYEQSVGYNIDTFCLKINDLEYACIYELCKGRNNKLDVINSIYVTTRFNHHWIKLMFENRLSKDKNTAYIKNCMESIKSIRFEKYYE